MQEFIEENLGKILLLGVALALWALLYAGYKQATAPSYSLAKNAFSCTASHLENEAPTYVVVNNMLLPVGGGTSAVCDQYTRKP